MYLCVCPENVAPLAITMVTGADNTHFITFFSLCDTHSLYLVKFLASLRTSELSAVLSSNLKSPFTQEHL